MRNKKYRIKGKSPYFAKKYGTPNPIIKIEGKDTDLWVNGWKVTKVPACLLYGIRVANEKLPRTGTVYYGHIVHQGRVDYGELVHETELGEEIEETPARVTQPGPTLEPAGVAQGLQ